MVTPKIAVQARIWGLNNLAADYPKIFDEVIRSGYDGAESRTSLLDEETGVLRYLSGHPSFTLIALHTGLKSFDTADRKGMLEHLLERMNRAGCKFLVASMGRMTEYAKWFELAAEITEQCGKRQIQFCYHNHAGEFENGYQFFDGITRYNVALAADIAWVHKAGKNVLEFIDRYSPYIKYVHVKDYQGEKWKELGQGEVDLKPVLQRISDLNLPWWTVEQDDTDQDPTVSATISRNYLRNEFGL